MHLARLQRALEKNEVILSLGKTAQVGDVLCHAVGFARDGQGVFLLLLEYDETFCELREEILLSGRAQEIEHPATYRQALQNERQFAQKALFCGHVQAILLGQAALTSHQSSMENPHTSMEDAAALLTKFLQAGWQPGAFAYRRLEDLLLTKLYVDDLPPVSPSDGLTLTLRPDPEELLLQTPLVLPVGNGPFAPVQTPWGAVQVRRVSVLNMEQETKKIFDHHRRTGQLDEATLAQKEAESLQLLRETVGEGCGAPVVEYDAPAGVQARFYLQSRLDALPEHGSHAVAVLVRPEVGQKADVLTSGVPLTAAAIEAELFSLSRQGGELAITFK